MDEAIKELVKRLRAANYSDQPEWTPLEVPLDEAAEAIEALVGDVKELTADVDALIADVSSLGDNLDKVAAERDYFRDAFKDCANREAMILQREAERAGASQSEVERLKGVLEFVDLNISKDNEAAKAAIRSALEAKP